MRFEEAYGGWQQGRLTQEDAARLLGVCERTFRRHIDRYEDAGLEGLIDKQSDTAHRRFNLFSATNPYSDVYTFVDGAKVILQNPFLAFIFNELVLMQLADNLSIKYLRGVVHKICCSVQGIR